MNLTQNTILITGGASGIGLALALELLNRDNIIIICGRDKSKLSKVKTENPKLITRHCDITNSLSRQEMCGWLKAEYPALNILVNNAGVQFRRELSSTNALDDLEQEIAVNFTAQVQLIGELLPLLSSQWEAMIINVTSGLAYSPMADVPVYCATKAAMHSFTLSLRHQMKNTSLKIVEMAPSIVDTNLGEGTRSSGSNGLKMMTPDEYAVEAISQLERLPDEVLVGISADVRKHGEALFEQMNQ
ncbi:MAG: SDR family NAD(P)-dependent oxidoreductase [Colwellia sp.]